MKPYRAIPKDGKDFVYGWYNHHENKDWISDWDKGFPKELPDGEIGNTWMVEVIPETVGQQVGCKDKNGDEIYEGDIIKLTHWFVPTSDMYPERWLTNSPIVVELPEFYQYILNDDERDIDKENIYEIIGNIHQHPKLLEKLK